MPHWQNFLEVCPSELTEDHPAKEGYTRERVSPRAVHYKTTRARVLGDGAGACVLVATVQSAREPREAVGPRGRPTREGASAVGTRSWRSRVHCPACWASTLGSRNKMLSSRSFYYSFYWQSLTLCQLAKEKKYLKGSDPFPQSRQKKGWIWNWEAKLDY